MPTSPTVGEIMKQFVNYGKDVTSWEIYDSGPREGTVSTVVKVVGNEITIVRQGTLVLSDMIT
jgi:uncharacterized beta-barrel protein YwiB (DUF1934 family)